MPACAHCGGEVDDDGIALALPEESEAEASEDPPAEVGDAFAEALRSQSKES